MGSAQLLVATEPASPRAVPAHVVAEAARVLSVPTLAVADSERTLAAAMAAAGASAVNDVSGGLADPGMARVVAEAEVPFIAMHWRGQSKDMREHASYTDVVSDVRAEPAGRPDALVAAAISPGRIVLDPGIGFAKKPHHDWELLSRLQDLRALDALFWWGPLARRSSARCSGTGTTRHRHRAGA